jgi:hypothetical protein
MEMKVRGSRVVVKLRGGAFRNSRLYRLVSILETKDKESRERLDGSVY